MRPNNLAARPAPGDHPVGEVGADTEMPGVERPEEKLCRDARTLLQCSRADLRSEDASIGETCRLPVEVSSRRPHPLPVER
mmetsp:Transcript_6216/g.19913  ORF Transcript_6216/g.19913 Transcript_6216/m.19913 type:complete len:81 (-) Transcript_6216:317-559(-)